MKLNESMTANLLGWLFVDRKDDLFKGSRLLKLLSKLDYPKLSFGFFILSVVCLWYEPLFTRLGVCCVEGLNLATVFLFLALLFCKKSCIKSTRAILYLLLFIVSFVVSGLVAALGGLELGMIITGIILPMQFVVAFIICSTFESKHSLINALLIISVPVLLIGFWQGLGGEYTSSLWVSASENLVKSRAFGFFGSPNVLGGVVMTTSIVTIFAFFEKRKCYYLAYGFISLPVLILTFSRSAWIGLAVGLVIVIIIKNWKWIFLTPLGLLVLLIPSVKQRLFVAASREYMVDSAIDGRVWSMNNALSIFGNSPIFGAGPGTYGGQTAIYYNSPVYLQGMQNGYVALPYTDNQWLEMLVQGGLIAIISIAGFFISLLVNNLRQYLKSENYFRLGIIAAIVAIIIDGFFGNIWEFGATAVLMGGYLGLGGSNED
jgi:O-antigen ligase